MSKGKTKGAVSFVRVSLKELNRILREDAEIIISKRFAILLGISEKTPSAENRKAPELEGTTKFTEEDLEN